MPTFPKRPRPRIRAIAPVLALLLAPLPLFIGAVAAPARAQITHEAAFALPGSLVPISSFDTGAAPVKSDGTREFKLDYIARSSRAGETVFTTGVFFVEGDLEVSALTAMIPALVAPSDIVFSIPDARKLGGRAYTHRYDWGWANPRGFDAKANKWFRLMTVTFQYKKSAGDSALHITAGAASSADAFKDAALRIQGPPGSP